MQRFTISLDADLADEFDKLIEQRGYGNRSEAVRDLIRAQLGTASLAAEAAPWCVATVSYVYDHHDHTAVERVMALQHAHHDLVISSLHSHLDHDHCLETVVLRGATAAVRACADQLVALRGVRHGSVHLVPLHASSSHAHSHAAKTPHTHFKPLS